MRTGISLPVREMRNDLGAIRDFAQTAEGLGLTHLRVPDQVFRQNSGHLHEPMMLLSYLAGITARIELVPSVIVLPARQTVLFGKQAVELDILSNGRLRLGIGVGGSREEYVALGQEFRTRGRRCSEQLALLQQLWQGDSNEFSGRFDRIAGGALDPLPERRSIPIWIGGAGSPSQPVIDRIGRFADGWFVLCSPEQYPGIKQSIVTAAEACGRNPSTIGSEAGVAVVGAREAEWQDRVLGWQQAGLSHLCLRTLGGGLEVSDHIPKMIEAMENLPVPNEAD